MQKINIPLLGLRENSEARAGRDGECHVLHNMTVDKEGGKVIAPPSKGTEVTATYFSEYYHVKAAEWLSVNNGKVYNSKGVQINVANGVSDGYVKSLAFMGNVVVMYCDDGSVRYAIYDGNYRYLGRLPELPRLNIEVKPIHVTTLTKEAYYIDSVEVGTGDEALRWRNASKGYFDECLSGLYRQGAFVDRTLVRVAARLFDGSYIAFSPIYYVQDSDELIENIGYFWLGTYKSIGRDNRNFYSCPRIIGATNRSNFFTSVRGFVPSFSFENYDLKRWRDIIVAIEVFATPSIMGHESKNGILEKDSYVYGGGGQTTITTQNTFDRYVPKSGTKIREEVSKAALFYRIAEYDLEGNEVWRLEETSPSQLAVQKALPVNEHPHELSSDVCRYLYNSKMHLAGVTERFRDGFGSMDVPGRSSSPIVQITQVVTIGTEQGEKSVITNHAAPMATVEGEEYSLTPLLHYPDARAKNIRLYVAYRNKWNSYTIARRDFPLTAHDTLNEAYFLAEASEGNDYATSITETIAADDVKIELEKTGSENAFVVAMKEKYPERSDFSGLYVFKYDSSLMNKWKLNITFLGDVAGTTEEADVSIFSYGLKLFVGDIEMTGLDVYGGIDELKNGETISVQLNYNTGALTGINSITIGGEEWVTTTGDEIETKYDGDTLLGFTLKISDDRICTRENVMRVSEVDNPFFFPAKSTYSFDATILAVCSNSVAVSQGQFGQHPLYVFTKAGVWLMTVDGSGAGTYLSQVPCSKEICNNGSSVTSTTRGVVFSTAMGLMMISGADAVNISESIAGIDTPELKKSGDVAERICAIVGKGALSSREAFADYLAGSFTAYDHTTGLLYVCNKDKEYVFVYNLQSGVWSTADGKYSTRVEYPDKLVLGSSYLEGSDAKYVRCTFNRNESLCEDVPVVMITRGCIFGETGFKRVGKSALRATVYGETMGFYTLGSVDGVAWELIGGKECVKGVMRAAPSAKKIVRDFVCRFVRSKAYRFIAFAFAGAVRSDARFALMECEVKEVFGERIR